MGRPDILVIDDTRTFRFPAVYARSGSEGSSRLVAQAWREVWLDYDLGHGETIKPVFRLLEDRASAGDPLRVGLLCVHTSGPVEGESMVSRLSP